MKTRGFYCFFFRLLFFKGACFKFYLITVLISSAFYYKLQRECLWNTVVVSFLVKFIAGCPELGKKGGLLFPETLCSLGCVGVFFSFFKESSIINF